MWEEHSEEYIFNVISRILLAQTEIIGYIYNEIIYIRIGCALDSREAWGCLNQFYWESKYIKKITDGMGQVLRGPEAEGRAGWEFNLIKY